MPLWLIVLATAAVPAWWVFRRAGQQWQGVAGLCPACGYDLRASPGRCPECGTPAAAGVTP
jgi:hypothetical protein